MRILTLIFIILGLAGCDKEKAAVVFQTDFGTKDGAVNAMKGVAYSVDAGLALHDLTHEIPAYNIWEASYRLQQSAVFWPKGTVFVSVVDPGVGTERRSIVLKTKSGHFFASPDNGTLTLVSDALGIEEVRLIDEKINRRNESDSSYTFHGRDVYAYTAARLASGKINFAGVGPELKEPIIRLDYQKPVLNDTVIIGNIPILDIQYGNVWTNIHDSLIKKAGIQYGDSVGVIVSLKNEVIFTGQVPFVKTFGAVPEGSPLGYMNSLMNFSLAVNMSSFADSFNIKSGSDWKVILRRRSHQ
jgi:S-adenosylmethionine hydrolase